MLVVFLLLLLLTQSTIADSGERMPIDETIVVTSNYRANKDGRTNVKSTRQVAVVSINSGAPIIERIF